MGLELLGGDDLSLLNHVLALPIPLSFLVFRLGSMDEKGSGRLGLDGHFGHRPSCVGLKELE